MCEQILRNQGRGIPEINVDLGQGRKTFEFDYGFNAIPALRELGLNLFAQDIGTPWVDAGFPDTYYDVNQALAEGRLDYQGLNAEDVRQNYVDEQGVICIGAPSSQVVEEDRVVEAEGRVLGILPS